MRHPESLRENMIATIDLGGTRTKYGLVDQGRLIEASTCSADAQGSLERHLDEVLERLRTACTAQGTSLDSSEGLGVLSTGLVDNREMRVLSTNRKYDDATGFDFRRWARQRAGLELRLDNDARGALIGEWRHGAGRGANHLLLFTIGTGIGTAAVIDGKPLTGAHFAGGNLGGHIIVRSGGRPCTCGGRGCLETEASGWVLPTLVREHPQYERSRLQGMEPIGFRELINQATAGDACAQDVWQHCLTTWGEAIVSLIHLMDPRRVIVGGGVMNHPDPVLKSLRATVKELAWVEDGQVEIVPAEFPDHAGLIGAAALFASTHQAAT